MTNDHRPHLHHPHPNRQHPPHYHHPHHHHHSHACWSRTQCIVTRGESPNPHFLSPLPPYSLLHLFSISIFLSPAALLLYFNSYLNSFLSYPIIKTISENLFCSLRVVRVNIQFGWVYILFKVLRVANYSKHLCYLTTALMVTTTGGKKQEVLVADPSHQVVIFPNPPPTGRDVTRSELGNQARGAELVLM